MATKFYDRYHRVIGIQLEFFEPSLTEQHHKDDCDVNIILKRFAKTGALPEGIERQGVYGDFTALPQDYRDAVRLIKDAQARFASLPSAVRERFGNDPAALLEFLDDPSNAEEAAKLGLLDTVPDDASAVRARDTRARASGAAATPVPTAEPVAAPAPGVEHKVAPEGVTA